jgi:drug/metabolite transporter (DMT)-like permease
MTNTNKNIFYIFLTLAMLGWGASWVNVKIISTYINEYEITFIRFAITAITLIPIIFALKKSFAINFKTFVIVILTAITLIAYMKYFFLGTKLGTAGLGGALVTTLIPINTFLIMALFFSRKIQLKDIFALILGACGVLLMLDIFTFELSTIFAIQNIYFLLASILWPVVTILSSKAEHISPIVFTFYLYIVTAILTFVFFIDVPALPIQTWDLSFYLNMGSLIIFATTFANTLYFLGIEKLGASNVSSFIFLVPFFALVLSAIILNESIEFTTIIGVIMTITAVKILNNIQLLKRK